MDWLATGEGAMYAKTETPNQEQTIQQIRQVSHQVDDILAADGLSIEPRKRQDLILTIYDMDSKRPDRKDDEIDVNRYSDVIRLVARR